MAINNKCCIITGASDGIGKETCKIIAREIGTIVIGCRNREKAEIAAKEISHASGNNNIILLDLDLSKQSSVRNFVSEFIKLNLPLDLLINNAGVMCPPWSLTSEGYSFQLATNHLGPFLLTNLLLSKLEQSSNPRILVLTSHRYKNGDINAILKEDINCQSLAKYDQMKDYALTKLCSLLFTKELQRKLNERNSKIIVNAIHPGIVQTSLQRDFQGGLKILFSLIPSFVFTNVDVSSKACARIALGNDPSIKTARGSFFNINIETQTTREFNDVNVWKKLWDISSKYCKISNELQL